MRIAVLANSFIPAFKIYEELQGIPDCVFFIVVSSSRRRGSLISMAANLTRIVISSIATPSWKPLQLYLGRKVLLVPKPLDHPDSLSLLRRLQLDVGLHKSGIIYREKTIKCFRLGILNPHIGILPAYRGRSVMEWSLIQNDPIGISVFFIDAGIDTGSRIIVTDEVNISQCTSIVDAKQYLFDLAGPFFRKAVAKLQANEPDYGINDGSGRRYYVMSKLFQDVVQQILLKRN